jgi:inner membrane protein
MDTITHGLSGVLLGRALSDRLKKLKPKAFVLIGVLAAIFPDFDFLFILKSKEAYLEFHRSITHSLFLLPFWAFLISFFFSWLARNKILLHKGWIEEGATNKEIVKETFALSSLGILSHIGADVITNYGTMFLFPIDNTKFAISSVYIIDLWFTGIIVAGILASWFVKKDQYLMARIFLVILLGYISLTQHIKYEVENYALVSLRTVHPQPSKLIIFSNPMAFSPYNWSVTAYDEEKEVYYNSEFNLNEVKIMRNNTWLTIPRWGYNKNQENVAKSAWNDPEFEFFRSFLRIPVFNSFSKKDGKVCTYFRDLRYTNPLKDTENPFIYGLCVTKDGHKYHARSVEGVEIPL